MGIGLPFTLSGCQTLVDKDTLYDVNNFNTIDLDGLPGFCFPDRTGTTYSAFYEHGTCILIGGNISSQAKMLDLLYYPDPGEDRADIVTDYLAFPTVSLLGLIFGSLTTMMFVLHTAGWIRTAFLWEKQRILSITDLFGASFPDMSVKQ